MKHKDKLISMNVIQRTFLMKTYLCNAFQMFKIIINNNKNVLKKYRNIQDAEESFAQIQQINLSIYLKIRSNNLIIVAPYGHMTQTKG